MNTIWDREKLSVGFVSTRLAGTDGVSLETKKWAALLQAKGCEVYFMAGQLDTPPDSSHLVEAAFFQDPDIVEVQEALFKKDVRTRAITSRIHELKERIKNGLALTDLRRLAVRAGYLSTIGRLEFDKLRESKIPLIVGIVINEFDHFVVFRGTDGQYVYLADPARGNVRTPLAEFLEQWQENMVLVVVKPGVPPERSSPLLLQPEETLLGESNRLYLRDRVTTKVFPY